MNNTTAPKPNQLTLTAPVIVAWTMALLATAASVYFIEILHNPVATLCWVDRMLMFSLLLILTVGIFDHDRRVVRYTIPFLALGLPLSFYQQLVHWDIIHLNPQACSVSLVCTTKYFNLFGFISQATLCFVAFVVIAVSMYLISDHHTQPKK
jgi:disulfide bond formation protein DsbB